MEIDEGDVDRGIFLSLVLLWMDDNDDDVSDDSDVSNDCDNSDDSNGSDDSDDSDGSDGAARTAATE